MGVGKSEGRPVMGWIRVAPVVSVTSPDAQAGRLPCGASAREPRRNRGRRGCKCRWLRATGAIDLPKMNWEFRAGFQEHTGVSLIEHMPNNPRGGYTRVHQD